MTPPRSDASWRIPALLAIVLCLSIWAWFGNTPFSRVPGIADYIGNENGRIAGNYLRYGYAATRGAQVRNLEPAPRDAWVHYQMHPATVDLLTSLVFRLTGSREPWAHRVLPLFATLASAFLLFRVARVYALPAWPALFLFAAFPMTVVHGLNLSYEPFCLAFLLGIVLAYRRGSRAGLLSLFFLGGLFDYPVLYAGPFLGLRLLHRSRDPGGDGTPGRSLLFVALLGFVCLASIGAHVAHTLYALGDLQGGAAAAWDRYILEILTAKKWMPSLGDFLATQGSFFLEFFTPAGFLMAVAGVLWFRKSLEFPELLFLFVGSVHLLVFRGHAMLHDFWLVYFTPFLALSGARVLAALPRTPALGLASLCLAFGAWTGLGIWNERAAPPVRQMGRELGRLFPDRVVLHGLATPAPWALETWREHPVMDGLLVLDVKRFKDALDRLASNGYLRRPQKAVLPLDLLEEGWLEQLHAFLPGLPEETRKGRAREWLVQDWFRVFTDPGSIPPLAKALRENGLDPRALRDRARRLAIALSLPPGSRIAVLESRDGPFERFQHREVRPLSFEKASTKEALGLWVAAWPGTPEERAWRAAGSRGLETREVLLCGRPFFARVRPPSKVPSLR